MIWFFDALLDRCPLWRRIRGGHWERWYVDHPVCGLVWHRVDVCSIAMQRRPNGLCRGTPICEDR